MKRISNYSLLCKSFTELTEDYQSECKSLVQQYKKLREQVKLQLSKDVQDFFKNIASDLSEMYKVCSGLAKNLSQTVDDENWFRNEYTNTLLDVISYLKFFGTS